MKENNGDFSFPSSNANANSGRKKPDKSSQLLIALLGGAGAAFLLGAF
jgi:hypothetical protein